MTTTEIRRADWPSFIEAASGGLTGAEVSVEIRAQQTRREAWVPLRGLAYEIRSDTLWIHTDRVEHEVPNARRLRALEQGGRLEALEIDGPDATYVLRFRVPAPQP